ncbi:hypothetical protein [Caudoviricetes sp.]|nr:hypothetical protein [Caudoviricetes sp.]
MSEDLIFSSREEEHQWQLQQWEQDSFWIALSDLENLLEEFNAEDLVSHLKQDTKEKLKKYLNEK